MVYLLSFISVLVMIGLPVAAAVFWRRRFRVPWLYFVVGMLTFAGAQVVHIPLNELLKRLDVLPELPVEGSQLILAAVALGLTAGLTEELARTVGYAIVKKARRLEDGILMGLGHGGIEAMVVGGVFLAASAAVFWFIQQGGTLPGASSEQIAAINEQLDMLTQSPVLALAAVLERLIAMTLHVILSVMVLQAFVRRQGLYVVAAVLYHAAVDAVAVYAGNQIGERLAAGGVVYLDAGSGPYLVMASGGPVGDAAGGEYGRIGPPMAAFYGFGDEGNQAAVAHPALYRRGGGLCRLRYDFTLDGPVPAGDFGQRRRGGNVRRPDSGTDDCGRGGPIC